MQTKRQSLVLSVAALSALLFGGDLDARASASRSSSASRATISANLTSLPLRFEPNRGQFDDSVSFLARGRGYDLFLTREGAALSFHEAAPSSHAKSGGPVEDSSMLRMRVVGGRSVQPEAVEPLPGISNYFVGNDPSKWRTGIEGYARVRYPQVLPGVDVVYYGTQAQRLEYDVVLAPGADARSVTLAYEGAESITIDTSGAAILRIRGGREVVQPAPFAYQVDAFGQRERVDAHYVRRAGGVGFAVGRFDRRRALVIDPTLVYSTFLGGAGSDGAWGVAIDSSGIYLAGTTASTNFPDATFPSGGCVPVLGTQSPPLPSCYHAFVTKLNSAGSAIVYSTYLGGNGSDLANGIAIDSAGDAFVAGSTTSTTFPTASPLQTTSGGGSDAFVTKLNPTGSALLYSTYVGGSGYDRAQSIAVDGAGEAFFAGFTASKNFPTASPFQSANLSATGTAFVSKLNAAGSALAYSTYLGGTAQDTASGIAIDSAREAFVVGQTTSADFPTMGPLQASNKGGINGNGFVTKLDAAGSGLVYSTYLGGSGSGSLGDSANDIALDGTGEAFVVGNTASSNFPIASALQSILGGPQDAFVAKLSSSGSTLVYSTYLGGSASDTGNSIAVDGAGEAFVTGFTSSIDFPTASPIQSNNAGKQDVFVARYNSTGAALLYSTYLGGSDNDLGNRIALDTSGNAVVVGELGAGSTNFPTVSPLQGTEAGSDDALIVKIASGSSGAAAPAIGTLAALFLAALLALAGVGILAAPRDRRLARA